jgi:hypothetical protein
LPHGFVENLSPLSQGKASPPGCLDTVVELGWAFDIVLFTVSMAEERVVVGGVAWGPRNAARLYMFLADFSDVKLSRTVRKLASDDPFSRIRPLRPSKGSTPEQKSWPYRAQESMLRT